MKKTFYFLLVLMFTQQAIAQDQFAHIKGEILLRLENEHSIDWALSDLRMLNGYATDIKAIRQISDHLNIWLCSFDQSLIGHNQILDLALSSSSVKNAQLNYILEKRISPNDTNYGSQWQYEQASDNDLDAEAAWDITTGGLTALGDTIVVCVIDDGLEVSHPDWGDNVWYNNGEIPNNGIDDDGNGYIDDFRGWNADNNNNDIVASGWFTTHGTPVAGIVAAQGDNNIGVTGVNWNVKLMFVVGGGTSAAALAAYNYPLSCRKLYQQSNGALGAFVVSTNASWGVDNQQCATYAPLVNELYDSLGYYGVLNAAATANANTNVDVSGDFPTSCSSDFLIAVTNMNQSGNKVGSAGYGTNTIDLGAYGEGTYTIATSASYAGFGGTSGATPHVTGAIGLLYSAPCPRLALLAKTQPQSTALIIKNIILNSTVPNTTLSGITVSGGVLNLKNALDSVLNIGCSLSGCHEPYFLTHSNTSGTSSLISWESVDSTNLYYYRYRTNGDTNWITSNTVDTFFQMNNLNACTQYEVQVAANCDSSNYSNILSFRTGDCCNAPSLVSIDSLDLNSALISWNVDTFVNQYQIEYRILGDTVWMLDSTSNNFIYLQNLDSCTRYEIRMLSNCPVNVNNQYSAITEIETKGCGNCTSENYCPSAGQTSADEWIQSVTIGGINNNSGDDGGYGNFVNSGPTTDLAQGSSYPISIDIGFNLGPWSTDWRLKAWMDFNQDDSFDDVTELVYDAGQISTATNTHSGTVTIPNNALLSRTRLRVGLRWGTNPLAPCDNPNYGEVEDYCINITLPLNNDKIDNKSNAIKLIPNPTNASTHLFLQSIKSQLGQMYLFNVAGQEIFRRENLEIEKGENSFHIPMNTLPKGIYLINVKMENGDLLSEKIIKS